MKQLEELAAEFGTAANQLGGLSPAEPVFKAMNARQRELHNEYERIKGEILGLVQAHEMAFEVGGTDLSENWNQLDEDLKYYKSGIGGLLLKVQGAYA